MIAPLSVGRLSVERVRRARGRARPGHPALVSWTDHLPSTDPIDFLTRGRRLSDRRVYWERPDEGLAIVGVDARPVVVVNGPDRFVEAAEAWRLLLANASIDDQSGGLAGVGPLAIGGFAFDPSNRAEPIWHGVPEGMLSLPRFQLTVAGGSCWLTVSALVETDTDPDALVADLENGLHRLGADDGWAESCALPSGTEPSVVTREDVRPAADWQALVAETVAAIRAGAAEKAVLARAVRLAFDREPDIAAALRRLRAAYPSCAIFALEREGETFLCATPERLARVRGGRVEVSSLAGTTARGATEEEDDRLGRELLASAKNRGEHELVREMLRERLADVCDELEIPREPVVLKVRNVQHLYTPVTGRLRAGESLLGLVERLHPTPAVGGFPTEAALALIREKEQLDRGWYAGPVGWVDARGEGEFVVALRSALLRPLDDPHEGRAEAYLFAGCGIVADSDPRAEYEESVLKLAPMLTALGAGT